MDTKKVRNAILGCLYDNAGDDDKLIDSLTKIFNQEDKQAYALFFNILTHLNLDPDLAESDWHEIIAHKEIMGYSLGRNVNLRTAICDYYCSINKLLRNPKIVEIQRVKVKEDLLNQDPLTGLYSSNYFDHALEREIGRSKRYNTELSVLLFDIDNFKKVNTSYGHLAGDKILQDISKIILTEIRAEDLPSRYGGEVFALILPQTGKAKAIVIGDRIRKHIEEFLFEHQKTTLHITMSVGLASFPIDAIYAGNLIGCAHEALHRAKTIGKNNLTSYSQDKRRYLRIDYKTKITIRKIDFGNNQDIAAKSKNISIDGILFESGSPLEIGSKIQLQIPLDTCEKPLQLIGTVVRVEVFDPDKYEIGVSFIEMDKETMSEIAFFTF